VLLRLEILIAMVPLHHKEQLGRIAILEQSFGSFFDCSALSKNEERLSQFRKTEIAGWLLTNDPESMGVLGIRIAFFSYSISSWMNRSLLNEVVILYTMPPDLFLPRSQNYPLHLEGFNPATGFPMTTLFVPHHVSTSERPLLE